MNQKHHDLATLSVRNLSVKENAYHQSLTNITFDLYPGETLTLVGAQSAGKSCLIQAVAGLLPGGFREVSGEIYFEGRQISALRETQFQPLRGFSMGIALSVASELLDPGMTILEHFLELYRVHHIPITRQEVTENLEEMLFDLDLPLDIVDKYATQLSPDKCQRVVMALALALQPDLLVADEPIAALDPTSQARVLNLIKSLQKRNQMAVLMVCQDWWVIESFRGMVGVMEGGMLTRVQRAEKFLSSLADSALATLQKRKEAHKDEEEAIQLREDFWKKLSERRAVSTLTRLEMSPVSAFSGDWSREAVLTVLNLHKRHDPRRGLETPWALDRVSLNVHEGEVLAVVGESGAGKSLLGRLIVQLDHVDKGEIHFQGEDLTRLGERKLRGIREQMQFLFSSPSSLNPSKTVGENVAQGLLAMGFSKPAALETALGVLELVGLSDALHAYPAEFAAGQRQLIAIARALASDPRLLIADEPLSALDPDSQLKLLRLFLRLKRSGIAMLYITHNLYFAWLISDRIAVMKGGMIIESGKTEEVLGSPRHSYTALLVDSLWGDLRASKKR